LSICKQPSAGGALSLLGLTPPGKANNADDFQDVDVVTSRVTFASSWVGVPGPGTWRIGICVINEDQQAIDDPDWSTGYAMVTNTSAAATAARALASAAHPSS
jgi:hypothetical protein